MSKALVAYFSASGTTAKVAKDLAAATGADLFEITPAQPYTRADLNWNNSSSRSSVEMNDEACRPAIEGEVANMAAYDTVFVGFPVWWYVEPRIIDTFLEVYDFAGKTVVPFATSGGSGLGRAPQRMQALIPAAVDLKLSNEEVAYLEESYAPHAIVGVMAQNKPADAGKEHVWLANAKYLKGETR